MKTKYLKDRRRKRLVVFLFACIFSVCIFTVTPKATVHAADIGTDIVDIWNELVNNTAKKTDVSGIGTKVDDVKKAIEGESKKGVASYFDDQKTTFSEGEQSPNDTIDNMAELQATVNNNLWDGIMAGFKGGEIQLGDEKINFDPKSFIETDGSLGKTAYGFFIVLGYSLVLLFFSISLIDQTIKYEIFTLRGFVNIFGRLLISKAVIDISGWVCTTIITITQNLCNSILTKTVTTNLTDIPEIKVETSDLFIVGPIVDILIKAILCLPVTLIITIVFVSGLLIMIKLLLRSLELTMLTVVSPAFFACVSSNTTVPYFKNFITTFLQAALQIVFMAIVYLVAVDKLTIDDIDSIADVGGWVLRVFPNAIIVLAMAIMMVKPPRVLTGLIK